MRRKFLFTTLIMVLLFTLSPFSEVLAKDNSKVSHQTVSFEATAQISQVPGSPNTVQLGNSKYYKTTGEIITGSLGDCTNWPAISNASVYMENMSLFSLDTSTGLPVASGFSIATITITTADGNLVLKATGPMNGILYYGEVTTTMFWVSVKATGSLRDGINAKGEISATFYWILTNNGPVGYAKDVTFSGSYRS